MNSVCRGSIVSRARRTSTAFGVSAGILAAGPVKPSYSSCCTSERSGEMRAATGSLRSVKALQLKGKSSKVLAYELEGAFAATAHSVETLLVGRDLELAATRAAIDAVTSGAGGVVRSLGRTTRLALAPPARPADEARVSVKETPGKLGGLGDTDSSGRRDVGLRRAWQNLERWRIESAPVIRTGQAERLGDTAWACTEQTRVIAAAARAHLFESLCRLERTHEHRRRSTLPAADKVETPVNPVRSVHVGSPRRTEQGFRSLGRAAEPMARRLVLVVRFDLDDPAADPVDEQGHADQVGCDLIGRSGEEARREVAASVER